MAKSGSNRVNQWPRDGENRPTGFWIENIRLEVLANEDEPPPLIGLWVISSDDKFDYDPAQAAIVHAARESFGTEKRSSWHFGDNENTAIIGRKIATKKVLLEMLANGESQGFVDLIVEQLEELAQLIPAVDRALDGIKPE